MSDKALSDLSNPDLEKSLIGAVLINNRLPGVTLAPSDFYIDRHKWIWSAIVKVASAGAIDIELVANQLEKSKKLKTVGGAVYLAECVENAPSHLYVDDYARQVKELSERRAAYQLVHKTLGDIYNQDNNLTQTITQTLTKLTGMNQELYINGDLIPEAGTWEDMKKLLGPIEWCWSGWLPKGMLTILAGESGSGKSALALRLAGCFINGLPWPNGDKFNGDPGVILWCEAEAAQAVNLDRAKSWGLPLDKFLTPFENPLTDIQLDQDNHKAALQAQAMREDVRLIIVDSLRGAHSRDENSSETMDLVKWLAQLARDTGKPLLLTHHLRKRSIFDGDKLDQDRLRGSSAIVQAARLVWALDVPDPYTQDWKRLQVIKSNLAKFPDPVGMTINDQGVIFGDSPEEPKTETLTDQAVNLLLTLLKREPMRQPEIAEEFNQAGISMRTVYDAKKRLGINSVRKPDGWYWSLPASDIEEPVN